MGVVNFDWSPDQVEKLKALHAEGLSAGQIAYQFGGKMTRNMICGKIARLGLPAHPYGIRSSLPRLHIPPKPKPKPVPIVIPAEAPRLVLVKNRPVTIETLESGMCKWPYGEGEHIHFCANPQKEHSQYCPFHHAKSYVPSRPRPLDDKKLYTAERQFGGRPCR